jgi:DNA-binding CsgD family transcriptional regulator
MKEGATGNEPLAAYGLVPPIRRLAPREQQIIELISRGKTDKAIAVELGMSVRTVRTRLERLYRKWDLHSRAEAVAFFSTATSLNAVAVGDFNGDGRPDLALAKAGSMEVSIMLGNGDGTFEPAASYTMKGSPKSIAVGDFNGDGKLDLAVIIADSGEISIMLGNGNGTFQAAANHGTGNSLLAIAAGDFNGDGVPDLAVIDTKSNEVSVLLGNGNGTFRAPIKWDFKDAPRRVT